MRFVVRVDGSGIVAAGVFVLILAGGAYGQSRPASCPVEVNAADLVREVRESEQWIHEVKSMWIRAHSVWTQPPEAIAARRAELKKQFPDMELDAKQFTGLRPRMEDTLELAFDAHRLRYLSDMKDSMRMLRIWDGARAVCHEKYYTHEQEGYALDNEPCEYVGDYFWVDLSWLRAGQHSFWWNPTPLPSSYLGRPEEFELAGREAYHGIDCWVLRRMGTTSPIWQHHVSVQDRRLHAITTMDGEYPAIEHRMFDYRELAPGWWFPMTQGYTIFEPDNDSGKRFASTRRDLTVDDVKINVPLKDELFEIEFVDGVDVHDWGHEPPLHYKYKANMPADEWQAILDAAEQRQKRDQARKREQDEWIGKPAPAFPETTWLNSKPLTWEDLKGDVVILHFWANWCGPCKTEMSAVSDIHKNAEKSGIRVIGVHPPGSKIADIRKVCEKYDLGCPICIDTNPPEGIEGIGAFSGPLAVPGLPYYFVVDQEGKIAGHGFRLSEVAGVARTLQPQAK